MYKNKILAGSICLGFLFASTVQGDITPSQAKRLNNDLTPLGAERAGNKAGTIPPWRGGLKTPPKNYQGPGSHHADPFPGDKPLFVITAGNMEKHSKHLTDGQKALFKTYPDTFKMPIFKTRRTAAAPQWIYDATFKNSTRAKLSSGGNGVLNSYGGIPFVIPENGVEAIWNHMTRWRGTYLNRNASEVAVQRDGDYGLVKTQQEVLFNYHIPDGSVETLDNIMFYYLSMTKAPARLAGGAVLVHETIDQVAEPRVAWGYSAGQRRVRRAPTLAYDTPVAASDGLRTIDDTDMYSGAPDRYNWKLLGKREIYIPYNSYRASSPDISYEELLMPGHINPEVTRYELHRVWVVEATLREDSRHIYSKRVFYLDEDTWGAAVADQYDARNELWRVSMAYIKNYYEVPATWSAFDVFHDLQARRYHVQGMSNEEKGTIDYSLAMPGSKYFTAPALRRRGHR